MDSNELRFLIRIHLIKLFRLNELKFKHIVFLQYIDNFLEEVLV